MPKCRENWRRKRKLTRRNAETLRLCGIRRLLSMMRRFEFACRDQLRVPRVRSDQ